MTDLDAYYGALRDRRGYDRPDCSLGGLSADEVRRRFELADGDLATVDPGGTVVSTGVSVTGPPHVGTLGQLMTLRALADAGFATRAVFADLVVYHAHGVPLDRARALAERYRAFASALGLDSATLTTQSTARDVCYTGQLLARYYDPGETDEDVAGEPPAFERALAAAYEEDGASPLDAADAVDPTAFGRRQAGLLLAADQLHPMVAGECDTVVLTLGADNHRLAGRIREVLDRSPYDGRLVGLSTPLVRGYDGYPKLSKRLPGSRFTLDAAPATIRDRILDPGVEYDRPDESVVFGMLRLASPYSVDDLEGARDACAAGGENWEAWKREYADWLVGVAADWRATGEG